MKRYWPVFWALVGSVIGTLVSGACGGASTAQAQARFQTTMHENAPWAFGSNWSIVVIRDSKTGACWVSLNDPRNGLAPAPKEVCE